MRGDGQSRKATSLRYYSLKNYFLNRFGGETAKISLDAGLTCPNRDGTLSRRGCLFCNEIGSGSGASFRGTSLAEQMARGLERAGRRAERFVAYFQSFTNTYAPVEVLRRLWETPLSFPGVVGLSVGTRPDCVGEEVLDLLAEFNQRVEVWLELGLQSASDRTLALLNRGHDAATFARASRRAREKGLKVLAHVILGLPGEDKQDEAATARFLVDLGLDGVKIHSLYISKGTGLAELHRRGEFSCQTREEFARAAVDFLELLPPEMVIHRLTGDPEPGALVAPDWASGKQETLNLVREILEKRDSWQGRGLGAPCRDYSAVWSGRI
ncbi:MAG: TIGR01212 family radical SAM protein [Pseudomonadota bacterium]